MRKTPISIEDARARMELKCAAAEHCTFEIRTSLRRMGVSVTDTERILRVMQAHAFIDDARFACAFTRDKYRFNAWGRHKIAAALRAKQIPAEAITEALEEIDSRQYVRIAFRTIATRLRLMPPETDRRIARQKLLRFGASRGYEMSLLIKILNSSRLWQPTE